MFVTVYFCQAYTVKIELGYEFSFADLFFQIRQKRQNQKSQVIQFQDQLH